MNSQPPLRAILFDAVGTLIVPEPDVATAYAHHAARFGAEVSRDEVHRRFHRAFASRERADRQHGDGRTSAEQEEERWRSIVGEVFPEVAEADALFEQLWDHFAEAGHWRLAPAAETALRALEQTPLVLGMASNFDARLHAVCRGWPALHRCTHVFISSELGHRKPARAFFQAIEQALELGPQELLLVGDDWENDFLAARAAGWQSVWVRAKGQTPPAEITEADWLPDLGRLPGWLARYGGVL